MRLDRESWVHETNKERKKKVKCAMWVGWGGAGGGVGPPACEACLLLTLFVAGNDFRSIFEDVVQDMGPDGAKMLVLL